MRCVALTGLPTMLKETGVPPARIVPAWNRRSYRGILHFAIWVAAAVLPGPGMYGIARAACTDVDFSAPATRAATVRATLPRTGFTGDMELAAGCPATGCATKAYVLPGDVVLIGGGTRAGHICATFVGMPGNSTTGWLPEAALDVITAVPDDWTGQWHRIEADIAITPAGSALHVQGDATWGAMSPERVQRGGVHIGELNGTMAPLDGVLAFTMGDKTLPYGKGDETDCRITMILRGPYLVARDNTNCGGQNVTFTGVFRHRG